MTDAGDVQIRCPENPSKMFAVVRGFGEWDVEFLPMIAEGNTLEFSCRECSAAARAAGRQVRVVHRFSLLGSFVETADIPV
jgi:hypothetical protein